MTGLQRWWIRVASHYTLYNVRVPTGLSTPVRRIMGPIQNETLKTLLVNLNWFGLLSLVLCSCMYFPEQLWRPQTKTLKGFCNLLPADSCSSALLQTNVLSLLTQIWHLLTSWYFYLCSNFFWTMTEDISWLSRVALNYGSFCPHS